MKSIEVDDVLIFHYKIIEKTGGSQGVREITLIESAIKRAFASFDGKDLYAKMEEKIAVITYGLIKNHGFVDGNKRIGVAVMLLLLRINDIKIIYTQKQLIHLGLSIADGSASQEDIIVWINNHRKKWRFAFKR